MKFKIGDEVICSDGFEGFINEYSQTTKKFFVINNDVCEADFYYSRQLMLKNKPIIKNWKEFIESHDQSDAS